MFLPFVLNPSVDEVTHSYAKEKKIGEESKPFKKWILMFDKNLI